MLDPRDLHTERALYGLIIMCPVEILDIFLFHFIMLELGVLVFLRLISIWVGLSLSLSLIHPFPLPSSLLPVFSSDYRKLVPSYGVHNFSQIAFYL